MRAAEDEEPVAIIRDQSRAVPPWTAPADSANVHGFGRDRLLDRRVLNIVLVVLVIDTLSRVV